jgi:hypothetical protein
MSARLHAVRLAIAMSAATFALAGAVIGACSTPPADTRIGVVAPDRAQFAPVAAYLDHRCGSLDCHGSAQRNLVVYGCEGLRLGDADVPGCRRMGGTDSTEEEIDATFRSVVGLEPAVMTAVVNGKGEHPELLTLVRKARGQESHKGGTLVVPGDAQDVCVASWLAGATDADACAAAVSSTP